MTDSRAFLPVRARGLALGLVGSLSLAVACSTESVTTNQAFVAPESSSTEAHPVVSSSLGISRRAARLAAVVASRVESTEAPSLAGEAVRGVAGVFAATESHYWVQRTPALTPGIRDSQVMAYDPVRANTVLFSGDVCTTSCVMGPNDTWTWNGNTWTKQSPATSPAARFWAGMAFDGAHGVALLYGGVQTSGSDFGDTWTWNGTAWAQQSPLNSPGARDAFGLAYDAARKVVVLFGGERCGNKTCSTLTNLNDTWEWNGTNWTQMTTAAAPSPRLGVAMAYDSARQVTVLFGGTNCSSTCPTVSEYGDTWEWNGTTWTQRSPVLSPSGRDSSGMTFDSLRNRTLLYGGYGASGDTWEWDGTNWTQVTPLPSPPYRFYVPMVFDSARGRGVIYGGSIGASDLGDTWEYYAHGSACTTGSQCDTGFCTDGVCCDTGSCGTCAACNTSASAGTCAPVLNAPDPPSCSGTQTCDGTGACKLVVGQACPGGNANCANGACVDGFCCNSACTGACSACAKSLGAPADGTCGPATKGYAGNPPCGSGYSCNGTATTCPTGCSADSDCDTGYYCGAKGTCVAQKALGGSCSVTAGVDCLQGQCRECATGNCVDGVCCNTACAGSCDVCAKSLGATADGACTTAPQGFAGAPTCAPYVCTGTSVTCPSACTTASECSPEAFCAMGHCQGTQALGQACGSNAACASGFCVDGVCCNSACSGECEACDVAESAGTCTPVAGVPHGARPACPTGSAEAPCSAAECDGTTRASCAGFVGSAVSCLQASCTNGVATLPASCDGKGSCPAPVTKQCAPYVCSGTACKDGCASDDDCASGDRCDTATGMCVAGVTCDGNHTITGGNGTTTDCAPYTCNPAGCQTACHSVLDCVSPAVCNAAGNCVLSAANAETGGTKGGCVASREGIGRASGASTTTTAFLFGLAFSGWLRRRKQRRAPGACTGACPSRARGRAPVRTCTGACPSRARGRAPVRTCAGASDPR
jgi:hypothetical protein